MHAGIDIFPPCGFGSTKPSALKNEAVSEDHGNICMVDIRHITPETYVQLYNIWTDF